MMTIIAHRGASADHPENTIEAFHGAATQGADWVELDARLTADGEIVVLHDAHLPDGRPLASVDHADLPTSIPTLAAALDACAPMGVNVEIKHFPGEPGFSDDRRLTDRVLDECAGMQSELLITSFDYRTIERVKTIDANVATGFLVLADDDSVDPVSRAAAGGHDALNPWDRSVDRSLVERCAAAGLAINVWTVDDPERVAELAEFGVDGVITNTPALARAALEGG